MPTLNSTIKNFVVGDSVLITRSVSNIDPADAVATALMTVKLHIPDTAYIFQKSINTGAVAGQGVIDDTGAVGNGDGTAALLFELTKANTALLLPDIPYYFDIELTTLAGAKYTPEVGVIIGTPAITT